VERMYRRHFYIQYKNQSSESKNQVIRTLQEALMDPWSMRPVRLSIEKPYNSKKESYKRYYY
jgi:hypothetical protein